MLAVRVSRQQVLDELRARGRQQEAERAAHQLPDPVDTEDHGGLLAQLGVSGWELEQRFGPGQTPS